MQNSAIDLCPISSLSGQFLPLNPLGLQLHTHFPTKRQLSYKHKVIGYVLLMAFCYYNKYIVFLTPSILHQEEFWLISRYNNLVYRGFF